MDGSGDAALLSGGTGTAFGRSWSASGCGGAVSPLPWLADRSQEPSVRFANKASPNLATWEPSPRSKGKMHGTDGEGSRK